KGPRAHGRGHNLRDRPQGHDRRQGHIHDGVLALRGGADVPEPEDNSRAQAGEGKGRMRVSQELLRFFKEPPGGRLALARRAGDEPLPPSDEVTVLFVLGFDKDPAVSDAAKKSLGEYPLEGLIKALERKLDP